MSMNSTDNLLKHILYVLNQLYKISSVCSSLSSGYYIQEVEDQFAPFHDYVTRIKRALFQHWHLVNTQYDNRHEM